MAVEYTIRRKVFSLLGAKFHIYDKDQDMIGFCKQKAFKLKEDIRIYTDESMSEERLTIAARAIIDFSAAYDVIDTKTGRKMGAYQRKGWSSIMRDSWIVLDANDNEVGTLKEDSAGAAIMRRFLPLGNLIPQKFHLEDSSNNHLADFRTHFNPFVHRMTVTVYAAEPLNPLMVLAGGVLLMAIEGRQNN